MTLSGWPWRVEDLRSGRWIENASGTVECGMVARVVHGTGGEKEGRVEERA